MLDICSKYFDMINFKNLRIWNDSVEYVIFLYAVTKFFPTEEKYALIQQMHKSSVSIPCNIAEGTSRKSRKEFSHYLDMALGSGYELETQLIIAKKLNYIDENEFRDTIERLNVIQASINSYNRKLIAETGNSSKTLLTIVLSIILIISCF